METHKLLVIDTDGVADDIRAVSLALQTSEVKLLAITCVNGCVSVDQAVANISRTLRANGKRIPIYKGAVTPLIAGPHTEVYFFGQDGLGDSPNTFPKAIPEDREAYEKDMHASLALIEIFSKNPQAVTLVCIGPLTNIALALKLNPNFAKLPASLVILGGNMYGMGNVHSHSTAEYNFSNDPEAAHIVLKEMQCPIKLIPWESFIFESEKSSVDFHAHLFFDHHLSKYFNAVTAKAREILERSSKQYAYCDEIAVAIAIDPVNVVHETKALRMTVELHGELTRGQVAVDWAEKIYHDDEEHPGHLEELHYKIHKMKTVIQLLDNMMTKAIEKASSEFVKNGYTN